MIFPAQLNKKGELVSRILVLELTIIFDSQRHEVRQFTMDVTCCKASCRVSGLHPLLRTAASRQDGEIGLVPSSAPPLNRVGCSIASNSHPQCNMTVCIWRDCCFRVQISGKQCSAFFMCMQRTKVCYRTWHSGIKMMNKHDE